MSEIYYAKDESGKTWVFYETDVRRLWWLTPENSYPLIRVFLLSGPVFVVHRYSRYFSSYIDDDGYWVNIPDGRCRDIDEWKIVPADNAIDLLIEYLQEPHKDIQHLYDERRIVKGSGGEKPTWNSEMREWRFCGKLLRQFTKPAKNQTAILDEFQAEEWRPRIDNPLKKASRQQVADAVQSLNANDSIVFEQDGTKGIRWRAKSSDEALEPLF